MVQNKVSNEYIDELARMWPNLTEDSVVFEVGAYKGRWACDIYDQYKCNVYAFEPQDWAYDILWSESLRRSGFYPFHFALGRDSGVYTMHNYGTDACSFVLGGPDTNPDKQQGIIRDIREFLHANDINHIDLMMINIEGYEYQLVWYLITSGIIHSIDTLVVQWHTFADPTGAEYEKIRDYVTRFFKVQFEHFPTLTAWERIK